MRYTKQGLMMRPWWVVLWGVLWRIPAMFVLAAIVAVRRAWVPLAVLAAVAALWVMAVRP
jgi:hypothetical protein